MVFRENKALLSAPIRATTVEEGVRIWPGDYARRRAGLTVLLDPSSQLPRSCRRGQGQAGAPEAAQLQGRTSLTQASGGRFSRAGKGRLRLDCQGSCICSGCSWRSGLASTDKGPFVGEMAMRLAC